MRKILLIDDNVVFIRNVRSYFNLVEPGYKVYTSGSGQDGIVILEHEKPDILLCDLFMLDMDGDEVIEKAKTISPHTRRIIFTAYTDEGTEKRLRALGVDEIIHKPIDDLASMVSRIKELCDTPR